MGERKKISNGQLNLQRVIINVSERPILVATLYLRAFLKYGNVTI